MDEKDDDRGLAVDWARCAAGWRDAEVARDAESENIPGIDDTGDLPGL